MSNYQDEQTRWHDKPTKDGKPSSNNGWIYTAYSKYLAPRSYNSEIITMYFNQCVRSYSPLRFDRMPNTIHPPCSKDEVIGALSLGLLTADELRKNHWNFCNLNNYKPKKLSLSGVIRAAKLLYKIRKEHRNYVWQNSLTDAYCLTFVLPPEDQYYALKLAGKRAGIFRTIIFYINTYFTLTGDNKSAKMLRWLQLEDLKHPLLRFVKRDEYVRNYFGDDHTFTKGLE